MALDPQAQAMLDVARNSGLASIHQLTVQEARRMYMTLTYTGLPEAIANIREMKAHGTDGTIKLRQYRPSNEELLPAIIFFHGGGWVLNDLDTHDHLCRALANQTSCAVVAIEYRLAPEHPFPAAVNDAIFGIQWVYQNARQLAIDPDRLGVAGDSAGATLAMAVTQWARDNNGPPLRCQALLYPVADHWSTGYRSYSDYATGYSLSKDLMIWFWQHYLPRGTDLNDPKLCPGRLKDFSGLPSTLVITAEFDPLRDEGEAYAENLRRAGVPVQCIRYDGMMHSFILHFLDLEKGKVGLAATARFIKRHLHSFE